MLHASKRQSDMTLDRSLLWGLQGSVADEHDARRSAKAAWVKAEWNRRYDNNKCFVFGAQGHQQLPPKPAGQGEERRSWPEARPGPQAAAAAAILKRSRSAYPEQNHRDGACVCHPYGLSWSVQDRLKSRTCCACGVYAE